MHPKIKKWFETKGRRLAELKVLGGTELFQKPAVRDTTKLTENEWVEFLLLTGQMDALLWALQPEDPDEATKFFEGVRDFLAKMEDEIESIQLQTGLKRIPRGVA